MRRAIRPVELSLMLQKVLVKAAILRISHLCWDFGFELFDFTLTLQKIMRKTPQMVLWLGAQRVFLGRKPSLTQGDV